MSDFVLTGRDDVRDAFTDEHCRRLSQWFDVAGTFTQTSTQPSSRERLWNCFSLLRSDRDQHRELAAAIIATTPVDHNHFEPIAAANLLLTFADRLTEKSRATLLDMVRRHVVNMIDVRFAGGAVNNFTCMSTFFLLAAGQLLERYDFPHEFASIPCVYTGDRLTSMGINGLQAMAWCSEHSLVSREFNSPTYSPISLHALAKIVELIDNPEAQELALEIELKVWQEMLTFYHPHLDLSCGPWSRAYRIDVLGQRSQIRFLLSFVGISPENSLAAILDDSRQDLIFHHDGDIPFSWSGPAWQISEKFHLPPDAIETLRRRTFPSRFMAPIKWERHGHIDPETHTYISVQDGLLPAGKAEVFQIQYERAAIGWRSESQFGHSFPICCHYALRQPVTDMAHVRSVLAGVMSYGAPVEWVPDQTGQPMESGNFNHCGKMTVSGDDSELLFEGAVLTEFAPIATDEISISSVVPRHAGDPDTVRLNDQVFTGQPIWLTATEASCSVADGDAAYSIRYRFAEPVTFGLWHWARFVRFAAFWYRGEARTFTVEELSRMQVQGAFSVERWPSPKTQR